MEKAALAELLRQTELVLLAFVAADKHLEQMDLSSLNPAATAIQLVKLCVEAAGKPLLTVVTSLYAELGIDTAHAPGEEISWH